MKKKLITNYKLKIKNCIRGFTLIELLIFMGIFSILLIVLFQLFIAIFDVQLESQSTSSVEKDARYIVNKFSFDVKNANLVTLPDIGTSGTTLTISDGINTNTYSLSNGNLNLYSTPSGLTNQLNSNDTIVSSINFLRLSDTNSLYNTITIDLTLQGQTIRRGGVESKTFNFTVGTR